MLLVKYLKSKSYKTIIFAGDLLNHARPTLEEMELVQMIINILSEDSEVIILAGNHEMVTNNQTTYDFWQPVNAKIVTESFVRHNLVLIDWRTLMSTDITDLENTYKGQGLTLVSHVRSNCGMIKQEYPVEILSDVFSTVILGDIHDRFSPFSNVHYTSSPYSTRFIKESNLKSTYGYIELDDNNRFQYVDLNLPSKISASCMFSDVSELRDRLKTHLLKLDVTGTIKELETLQDEPLCLFNKIINDNTNDAVIVDVRQPLDTLILDNINFDNAGFSKEELSAFLQKLLKDIND